LTNSFLLYSGRTDQEYELENPEGDQLLDALSLLEIHRDEARDGLAKAKIGLSRLSHTSSRRRRHPRLLPLSPSASILKKTLDSNFAKKG
jgi:hypothetical protein